MSLLTDELRAQLPRLYAQEGSSNPMVYVKLFLPGTAWTWYVTEGEAQEGDYLFYGYTFGFEGEWGYFLESELEKARNRLGLSVERDLYFTPALWKEVAERHQLEHGQSLADI